jgi:hypothetical protein
MLLEEKRCKMAFMMCTYLEVSTSLQGLKYSHDGLTVILWGCFPVVIHILWINLWITMLIACKFGFYVFGL